MPSMSLRLPAARLAARIAALVLAVGALLPLALPARAQQPTAEQFRSAAQKLADAVNDNKPESVLELLSPVLRKGLDEQAALTFYGTLKGQYGRITQIGTPTVTGTTARIPVTAERGSLMLTETLDPQNLISGLYVTPASTSTGVTVPQRNTVPMRLPANGEWYVYWGGATEADNFHVRTPSEQRAFDLVMTDADGQTHRVFGFANTDYYSYGKDVLAPADGTVVSVVSGVPDNTPGIPNPYIALGNMVVLKIADNTFAFFGHLQPNSITVKPGDSVKSGQVIAKVGNTGNVTEPYLHFHLQNTPSLQDGVGFAPYFTNVRVVHAGQTSTQPDYTPVRGDRISPATGAAAGTTGTTGTARP